MDLLDCAYHRGGDKFGYGAGILGGHGLELVKRNDHSFVVKGPVPHFVAVGVISLAVLVHLAFLSAEFGEAVFGLPLRRSVGRIEDKLVVIDFDSVTESQIFGRKGKKEGLSSLAVCEGVENVQYDTAVIDAYLEKEAAVEFVTEGG